jgi:hypothetical protein
MQAMRRKLGDIYRINLTDGKCSYMQHLANDATQLGSAVVLVLFGKYVPKESVAFDGFDVQDGFLAHVFIKAGKILGVWERSEWSQPVVSEPIPAMWATCNIKDMQLEFSADWSVWQTNQKMRAPASEEELASAELGLVISPPQIVHRIEYSTYSIRYPRRMYPR